ncbi:uncharacterized, partial [Tachysurus ichikawai]
EEILMKYSRFTEQNFSLSRRPSARQHAALTAGRSSRGISGNISNNITICVPPQSRVLGRSFNITASEQERGQSQSRLRHTGERS